MCCGNKRSQLQNGPAQKPLRSPHVPFHQGRVVRTQPSLSRAPSPERPTVAAQAAVDRQTSVQIYYLETSPVRVQGLSTGCSYEFSGSQPVQSVDARDASSLLNTRFFRRA
jgi:hypothetical protein